jgi:TnpA family transposase
MLSTHSLSVIRRRRDDQNRLGFAVQLCYLRHPGRLLAFDEIPYSPILGMAAAQLKLPIGVWSFDTQGDVMLAAPPLNPV